MNRYRNRYRPAWGDAKHREAIASASRLLFGEDLTEEILNQTRHRQLRTASPGRGPQPYPDAEAKVWRDLAIKREADPRDTQRLKALVESRKRAGR